MASNETHAEIVRKMRGPYYKMGRSNASLDKQMMDYMSFIADRIEAAHKREIAAKDDERLTIVANYENVIAAKDREIAELRECLKEAIREMCPFTRMSCRYGEQCDYECGTQKWRNALKGSNNATK